jgi:hypothetical protein
MYLSGSPGHALETVTSSADKLGPDGLGDVEATVGAAVALVHDGGGDGLALVGDVDLHSAVLVGGVAGHDIVGGGTVDVGGEGNHHVGVFDGLSAGSESTTEGVDGHGTARVGLTAAASGRGGGLSGSRGGRSRDRSNRGGGGQNGRLLDLGGGGLRLSGGWLDYRRLGSGLGGSLSGGGSRRRRHESGGRFRDGNCGGPDSRGGWLDGSSRGNSPGGGRGTTRGPSGLLVEGGVCLGGFGRDLVGVDGGVGDLGLDQGRSVRHIGALVEHGSSSGHGAEEHRGDDAGSLHFDGENVF